MSIKVKYFDKNLTKLEKTDKGDLVDLRVSKVFVNDGIKNKIESQLPCSYKKGDILFIKLGIGMKLPYGKMAKVYPRSSTFKNYGLILTNSVGNIDFSYSGNTDEWCAMMYALKDGQVNYNDRILQFEIVDQQMNFADFEEVEELDVVDRGGYGSTGVK